MIDNSTADYVNDAKGWEADSTARSKRSERIAWRVAGASVLVAVAAVVAVALLTPLKQVEPFIVRVDRNTGATDIVTRVSEQQMSPDEAIDKYWLAAYVRAREGYSDAFGYSNYKTVDLMSSPEEGKKYYAVVDPENPKSVFNTHAKSGKVEIKILSISFLDGGVASVRYTRRDELRSLVSESRWVATVGYRYEDPPLTEAERLINPLGFQVVDYRTDAETGASVTSQPGAL